MPPPAIQRLDDNRDMTRPAGNRVDKLSGAEIDQLSCVFKTPRSGVAVSAHPLSDDKSALRISYDIPRNVPSALCVYFNTEFYSIEDRFSKIKLQYKPNDFAYLDPNSSGLCFFLSFPTGKLREFVKEIMRHRSDISYVIENPELLFMVKPSTDYRSARRLLESGYQLVL